MHSVSSYPNFQVPDRNDVGKSIAGKVIARKIIFKRQISTQSMKSIVQQHAPKTVP